MQGLTVVQRKSASVARATWRTVAGLSSRRLLSDAAGKASGVSSYGVKRNLEFCYGLMKLCMDLLSLCTCRWRFGGDVMGKTKNPGSVAGWLQCHGGRSSRYWWDHTSD